MHIAYASDNGGNVRKRRLIIGSVLVAGALALTGCASGDDKASSGSDSGVIRVWNSEPQNPLVPGDTNEAGGGFVLDNLFAGLIYYDAKGAAHNDVAESITTDDGQNYDIKLKSGQKFSNGEAVTASSFVDAWNFTAQLSNKQKLMDFFQNIVGYDEEKDSELTGLKVVSDTEFTVALKTKVADFGQRLGTNAFFPLPKSAVEDIKAFGENPVGNGPYKFKNATAWKHNEQLELVANDEYTGARKAKNSGVTFVVYNDLDSAYKDVQSGNLDVLYQIPDSAAGTYKSDFPDTNANEPAAIQQSFTIPQNLAHFSGAEGALRREAISLSINRPEITKVIFHGTRAPSTDFSAPTIAGFQKDLDGSEVFSYNPKKAKELWAQADAIAPWSGTFTLAYNADSGHQGWVDAVCNNIKNALGIEAQGAPVPTFSQLRDQIVNRSIGGAFRSGWQGDYPGLYNFLGPVFSTNGSSNDGDYSSPEFDALLQKGITESDTTAANKDFAQAQQVLFTDLPQISLWYQNVTAVWDGGIKDVAFSWNPDPILPDSVKE